jgi:hypothetical protein
MRSDVVSLQLVQVYHELPQLAYHAGVDVGRWVFVVTAQHPHLRRHLVPPRATESSQAKVSVSEENMRNNQRTIELKRKKKKTLS